MIQRNGYKLDRWIRFSKETLENATLLSHMAHLSWEEGHTILTNIQHYLISTGFKNLK